MSFPPPVSEPLDWTALDHTLETLQQAVQPPFEDAVLQQISAVLTTIHPALQTHWVSSPSTPEVTARTQRHHTEMHRLLRLLATDMAFYQSARSVALRQQRQQQLGDRLLQLRQHVQAMAQLSRSTSL